MQFRTQLRESSDRSTPDPVRRTFVNSGEMYLRAIFEFEEENGIAPKRAALPKRLGITRSAVHQHLNRLVQDGLVHVSAEKRIQLTQVGRTRAGAIVRKHRLAERLLVDVVGLEWELCHVEAVRWQHVLGEDVERKLLGLLDDVTYSPFGIPIPALDELGRTAPSHGVVGDEGLCSVEAAARDGGGPARVCRIQEPAQEDPGLLACLRASGVVPGGTVEIVPTSGGSGVATRTSAGGLDLDPTVARSILVRRAGQMDSLGAASA